MDFLAIVVPVVIVGLIVSAIAQRFTKSGKERLAQKKQQAQTISEQKAAGTFRSSENQKSNQLVYVIAIWAFVGWALTAAADGTIGFIIGALWGLILGLISRAIGRMAENKGRSFAAFFWLSALINPILMWIIAAAISDGRQRDTTLNTTPLEVSDLADQITALKELRDKGLITKSDFESKKKDLLGRL